MFLKAFMTFEPSDIGNSLVLLRNALVIADHYRKKDYTLLGTVTSFVKGVPLSSMTRLQRHAELIFAEAYLLKAVLTIVHDESLLSFVTEGIHIRSSYMTYSHCQKWLKKQSKKSSGELLSQDNRPNTLPRSSSFNTILRKIHKRESSTDILIAPDADFTSGVLFGTGIFNLMLSLLPSKFVKIIEIMGFQGNRNIGLKLLGDPKAADGVRGFICDLSLLAYHTILSSYITLVEPDFNLVDKILNRDLKVYPNGALHLFFAGRSHHARGKLEEAIKFYESSIKAQQDWVQLHHICYWEMSFCFAGNLKFSDAAKAIETLKKDSKWSKAIYHYLIGVHLYMAKTLGQENIDQSVIDEYFNSVPKLVQKVAGRSIPLEKYVARKSRKYFLQDKRLWYPAFEFFVYWNMYRIMGPSLPEVLKIVEDSLKDLEKIKDSLEKPYDTFYDDYVLALLVKSVCLREMGNIDLAILHLTRCQLFENDILLDHYLSPFARYELGMTFLKLSPPNLTEAKKYFEEAKSNYKKYSLENALHFRIHNALQHIQSLEGSEPEDEED